MTFIVADLAISGAELFLEEIPGGSLRPKEVSSRSSLISIYNSEMAHRFWGPEHCIPGCSFCARFSNRSPPKI